MAAYGRKTMCRFLQMDLQLWDRMSEPFEKKSTDSQLGFLFVDFFHSSVFITTLATAKNLNMGPNEKEPVCHFFRWVLYNNKILHSSS